MCIGWCGSSLYCKLINIIIKFMYRLLHRLQVYKRHVGFINVHLIKASVYTGFFLSFYCHFHCNSTVLIQSQEYIAVGAMNLWFDSRPLSLWPWSEQMHYALLSTSLDLVQISELLIATIPFSFHFKRQIIWTQFVQP